MIPVLLVALEAPDLVLSGFELDDEYRSDDTKSIAWAPSPLFLCRVVRGGA